MTLDAFIDGIDGFLEKRPSEQIPFFGCYLTEDQGMASFSSRDIEQCFDSLHLPAYSNISAYLTAQKKVKRFLKCKTGGYALSRRVSETIASQVGIVKRIITQTNRAYFQNETCHDRLKTIGAKSFPHTKGVLMSLTGI